MLSILSAFILSQDQTLRSIYILSKITDNLHQFIVVFAFIVFLYSVANVLNYSSVPLSHGQDIYYHRYKISSTIFLIFFIFLIFIYIIGLFLISE